LQLEWNSQLQCGYLNLNNVLGTSFFSFLEGGGCMLSFICQTRVTECMFSNFRNNRCNSQQGRRWHFSRRG